MTLNWGTGVAATYLVFAGATTGFVVFAMSRPVSLVSPQYYTDSLREDKRLAARRNANSLGSELTVECNGRDLVRISIPASHGGVAEGSVTLYRDSDVAADRTFHLALDAQGRQDLTVATLARGRWIVQLRWSAANREYYFEQPVTLK
jgi:hypothetical protein